MEGKLPCDNFLEKVVVLEGCETVAYCAAFGEDFDEAVHVHCCTCEDAVCCLTNISFRFRDDNRRKIFTSKFASEAIAPIVGSLT